MVRQLKAKEVEFILEVHVEDVPIEGNCSAIDPKTDAEAARWIHEQLEAGNEWAWCCVVVKARWRGFEGQDSLGCCSYTSEASFKRGGYYRDMKLQALAHLNQVVAQTAEAIAELQ